MKIDTDDGKIQLGARLLLQLASALNWILKHELSEISFDILLEDFGKTLGADHAFVCIKEVSKNKPPRYKMQNVWCGSHSSEACEFKVIDFTAFPFLYKMLEAGKSIFMGVDQMPLDAKKFLESLDIKFVACTPISKPDGITTWGLFGFSTQNVKHNWTGLESAALEAIGAIMGTIVYKIEEDAEKTYEIKAKTAQIREIRENLNKTVELTSAKLLQMQSQ